MNKIKALFYTTFVIGNILFCPQIKIIANPPISQAIINKNIAQELANYYLQKTPITTNPNLTRENAIQVQNQFIEYLTTTLGKIVGYKIGLTNPHAQKRFNVNTPIAGILLEKMLRPNNSVIPVKFASIPRLEGDLMVRVGNDKINNAKTPAEILANLDTIIPFIELPDLIYSQEVNLDANSLIAVNVGARLGIMGEEIPLNNDSNWLEKIAKINLTLVNENNQEIGQGNSELLLGNPLNVVLWLKNDLQNQGKKLKKGDLISLGTITPMIPITKNEKITAKYKGLRENKTVDISVTFK